MNLKIFTIFILLITVFSFFTFTFATEETTEEVQTITLISPNSNSYKFVFYNGEFDSFCYLFYNNSANRLDLYFFEKKVILSINNDTNKYCFTTEDGSDYGDTRIKGYYCTYNNELGYFDEWSKNYSMLPKFTGNTLNYLSSTTYEYIANFDNIEPLKTIQTEIEPDEPIEPDTPVEPDEPDTPNEEIVIDPTEINNNLSKIYTGIQFIVSFLSLGAVVLLIYIVYKLFSIFFPF